MPRQCHSPTNSISEAEPPVNPPGASDQTPQTFLKIPKDLLRRTDLSTVAKLLYAQLDDWDRYSRRNGNPTNPGTRRLAADLGVSHWTIQYTIEALKTQGLISVEKGKGRSTNCYTVHPISARETFHKQESVAPEKPSTKAQIPSTKASVVTKKPSKPRTITKNNQDPLPAARVRGEIWDTLENLFDFHPKTKSEKSRLGKAVRDLTLHKATEIEIRKRYENYKTNWPDVAITLEAFVKHWQTLKTATAGSKHDQRGDEAVSKRPDKWETIPFPKTA